MRWVAVGFARAWWVGPAFASVVFRQAVACIVERSMESGVLSVLRDVRSLDVCCVSLKMLAVQGHCLGSFEWRSAVLAGMGAHRSVCRLAWLEC